jgi:hypothetical protein
LLDCEVELWLLKLSSPRIAAEILLARLELFD